MSSAYAANPSDSLIGEPLSPAAPAVDVKQLPEYLKAPYTGYGNMNIKLAIEQIVPKDTDIQLNGVNSKANAQWKIVNGKLFYVLDEIALQNSLTWRWEPGAIIFESKAPTLTQTKSSSAAPEKIENTQFKKIRVAGSSLKTTEKIAKEKNLGLAVNEEIVEPPQSIATHHKYEINSEDDSLYLALRRWSVDAGYQLVWDAGKDFPAKKTTYSVDSFEDAIARVMADTGRSSYPLHACSYKNNVVRILHISQSCERKEGPQ